ncbi:MAG: response regulator [Thermoanaerobaculia bacterium]
MDDELLELVPIFVAEARERLQRLIDLLPDLTESSATEVEVKRELHTLKGAGRMMAIAPFADVCHAAEELLFARPPDLEDHLLSALDALAAMVEAVESARPLAPATALLNEFARATRAAEVSREAGAPLESDTNRAAPAPAPPLRETAAAGENNGEIAGTTLLGLEAFAERGVRVRAAAVVTGRLLARLAELANLAEDGVRDPQPAQALAVVAASLRQAVVEAGALETRLARTGEEQIEAVLAMQIVPLRPTMSSLARFARELARQLGRQVDVELQGEETRLDRRITRELDGVLRHLVANAVDHGIESPEDRRLAAKPPTGRLQIFATTGGRGVELTIRDDGRGIDPQEIARRAVAGGFLGREAADALSDADALRLVFLPGFSTRESASGVSGRGIGLDAVAAAVARLGGEARVASTPGSGLELVLDLPVARRGERVVIARVGSAQLAIPAVAVRRIHARSGIVVENADGQAHARIGDQAVPFVRLDGLLGAEAAVSRGSFAGADQGLLVEASVAGRPVAFAVDRVEGEVELLVRPLPPSVLVSPLIEGVGLLPSGDPIAVLAPQALLRREFSLNREPSASPAFTTGLARELTRLLLVDDSRVTREMERRILEDAGFRVEVAGDGAEALRRLASEPFDCLITDIEMPNVDGLELTAELRRSGHFARLPIVVVSTRERPEDRLRGLRAGADAYLTKQSLVATDLVETVRRLTGN